MYYEPLEVLDRRIICCDGQGMKLSLLAKWRLDGGCRVEEE